MIISNKEQIKQWNKRKIIAIFKNNNNVFEVYGFKFKDKSKEDVLKWLSQNFPGENFGIEVSGDKIRANHFKIEETWFGTEHVREQSNGISVRVNVNPSPEYKAKLEERAAAQVIEDAKQQEILAKEKLIKDKIRELAISELEKEGKL